MSEEIKQKDKLKDGFEDLVINDTGKNFDDDMFIIQDWWLKQFDSLLSQALQKRDEEILGLFIGETKMELQKRLSTLTTK